jgi:hypothetical protein
MKIVCIETSRFPTPKFRLQTRKGARQRHDVFSGRWITHDFEGGGSLRRGSGFTPFVLSFRDLEGSLCGQRLLFFFDGLRRLRSFQYCRTVSLALACHSRSSFSLSRTIFEKNLQPFSEGRPSGLSTPADMSMVISWTRNPRYQPASSAVKRPGLDRRLRKCWRSGFMTWATKGGTPNQYTLPK